MREYKIVTVNDIKRNHSNNMSRTSSQRRLQSKLSLDHSKAEMTQTRSVNRLIHTNIPIKANKELALVNEKTTSNGLSSIVRFDNLPVLIMDNNCVYRILDNNDKTYIRLNEEEIRQPQVPVPTFKRKNLPSKIEAANELGESMMQQELVPSLIRCIMWKRHLICRYYNAPVKPKHRDSIQNLSNILSRNNHLNTETNSMHSTKKGCISIPTDRGTRDEEMFNNEINNNTLDITSDNRYSNHPLQMKRNGSSKYKNFNNNQKEAGNVSVGDLLVILQSAESSIEAKGNILSLPGRNNIEKKVNCNEHQYPAKDSNPLNIGNVKGQQLLQGEVIPFENTNPSRVNNVKVVTSNSNNSRLYDIPDVENKFLLNCLNKTKADNRNSKLVKEEYGPSDVNLFKNRTSQKNNKLEDPNEDCTLMPSVKEVQKTVNPLANHEINENPLNMCIPRTKQQRSYPLELNDDIVNECSPKAIEIKDSKIYNKCQEDIYNNVTNPKTTENSIKKVAKTPQISNDHSNIEDSTSKEHSSVSTTLRKQRIDNLKDEIQTFEKDRRLGSMIERMKNCGRQLSNIVNNITMTERTRNDKEVANLESLKLLHYQRDQIKEINKVQNNLLCNSKIAKSLCSSNQLNSTKQLPHLEDCANRSEYELFKNNKKIMTRSKDSTLR